MNKLTVYSRPSMGDNLQYHVIEFLYLKDNKLYRYSKVFMKNDTEVEKYRKDPNCTKIGEYPILFLIPIEYYYPNTGTGLKVMVNNIYYSNEQVLQGFYKNDLFELERKKSKIDKFRLPYFDLLGRHCVLDFEHPNEREYCTMTMNMLLSDGKYGIPTSAFGVDPVLIDPVIT